MGRTKKLGRFTQQTLLKNPCPFCQDVWCNVTGTPSKKTLTKCRSKGHLLLGPGALTRMTWKEIVEQVRNPVRPTKETIYGLTPS